MCGGILGYVVRFIIIVCRLREPRPKALKKNYTTRLIDFPLTKTSLLRRFLRLHFVFDLDFICASDLHVVLVVENDFIAVDFRERDGRFP
jgi:hypothetical protein